VTWRAGFGEDVNDSGSESAMLASGCEKYSLHCARPVAESVKHRSDWTDFATKLICSGSEGRIG
jgi:hypothetical protein